MSNYSLVINSQFDPFSYQELTAPLDRQELYQEKLIDEYDKLSSQTDVLEAMGRNDRDKNSGEYSRYKSYSDSLEKERDNLYNYGLDTESRQRLSAARKRYNTEIVPIQNAWNKREQEASEQMKAALQNPSIMFTRDARNSNLGYYVNNPVGGYGVINGANIAAQMANMAKNLAKQIRSGSKQNIDPYTYRYIEKYGLDENIIRNWQDSPTLSAMFKQVMQANGVTPEALADSDNMQNIIDQSTNYAEMGMWSAMGEDRSHIQENFGARLAARVAAEEASAIRRARAASGGSTGNEDNDGSDIVVRPEAVGLTPVEQYKAANIKALEELKTGHDALKSSYFGKTIGKVNPMAIYEEYQKELKKHPEFETVGHGSYTSLKPRDTTKIKEAFVKKYAKYGITNILSKEQYNALSALGYSSKEGVKSTRYSNLLNEFNTSVEQKTRYSTNMSDYEGVNDVILPNLKSREKYGKDVGTIWEITKEGKIGKSRKIDDMNLHSADNTKGNKVSDVLYDPSFSGKIVLKLSDGSLYVTDPEVYSSSLSRMIKRAEQEGAPAETITKAIKVFIDSQNKVRSKTSSKI